MLESSEQLIQKILSNDAFKNIDKCLIEKRYFTDNVYLANEKSLIKNVQVSNIISEIKPEGITINQSGTYTFSKNIIWKPISDSTAITITVSNVTIDMKGFYLKCCNPKNYKTTAIGAQNVSNLILTNNKILYSSFYGIQIVSSTGITITNTLIYGINYKNLNIRLLTPCGIFISKSSQIKISGSEVKNLDVTTDSCAGIQLSECTDGNVLSCKVKNLINNDGAVQGFSCLLSSNITHDSCKSIGLQSFFNGNILTSGHTVLGFCPIFSENIVYTNCLAANLTGCCDDCHGISIFLDIACTVKGFTSYNIVDGVTQTNSGAKATGIEIYGLFCTVDSCYAKNIKAINPQDKQSAGFSCSGVGNIFRNCRAKNVVVVNEFGQSCKKIGFGVGYGWAPDPRPEFRELYAFNTLYEGCTSTSCQVAFDTFNHINSVWKNITSTNSGVCLLVNPGSIRTLSCNPCSECNPPINYVAVNVATGNQYSNVKCNENCGCK